MLIALLLLNLLQPPVATGPRRAAAPCPDPATPIPVLAKEYTEWPATTPGRLTDEAFATAQVYFRTGSYSDYHRALLKYQNLLRDMPRDVRTHLMLAVLYASGNDLNFEQNDGYRHTAMLNHTNADTYVVREAQWTIQHDSTQWLAAVVLTRIAMSSPVEEDRTDVAMDAVNRALTARPDNLALQLARRDLLVRQERYSEAADYLAMHPSDCASYGHARAELTMIQGDSAAGSRLYLKTLENAKPDELARFYDDIRVMASLAQRRAFKAMEYDQRGPWLREFWENIAASSGRTVETRVTEQIVRAAYADAHFLHGSFQVNMYYSSDTRLAVPSDTSHIEPWDAAGVYYVQHGPPDESYFADQGDRSYMAWVYRTLDPPVIVVMQKPYIPGAKKAEGGWRPVEIPPCGPAFLGRFDTTAANELLRTGEGGTLREIYYALSAVDPRYGELINYCTLTAAWPDPEKYIPLDRLWYRFKLENRKVLPRLAHTESANPHFRGNVRMSIGAWEFRGTDAEPEVVTMAWIPMRDLRDSTSVANRLRFTFAVTDSMIGSMRMDTVVALPTDQPTGVLRLPTVWRAPDIHDGRLRVTAVDPADTLRGATRSAGFHVRTDNERVTLSDMVIADPGMAGPLVRGTTRLAPLPDNTVQPDDAFRLFFELYGATAGTEAETTIHVRRTDAKTIAQQLGIGKRDERTIGFHEKVELDSRGFAIRDVDIAGDLVPGHYMIDVTVKLANGIIAKRSAPLIVQERK